MGRPMPVRVRPSVPFSIPVSSRKVSQPAPVKGLRAFLRLVSSHRFPYVPAVSVGIFVGISRQPVIMYQHVYLKQAHGSLDQEKPSS